MRKAYKVKNLGGKFQAKGLAGNDSLVSLFSHSFSARAISDFLHSSDRHTPSACFHLVFSQAFQTRHVRTQLMIFFLESYLSSIQSTPHFCLLKISQILPFNFISTVTTLIQTSIIHPPYAASPSNSSLSTPPLS